MTMRPKFSLSFSFLILSFLFSAFTGGLCAQPAPPLPRLVVFVMLDELGNDQLSILEKRFDNKGFNRLRQQGRVFRNARGHSLSGYAGTHITTLLSGAHPSAHGIINRAWLNARTGEMQHAPGLPVDTLRIDSEVVQVPLLPDYLKLLWGQQVQVAGITVNNPATALAVGREPDFYFELDKKSGDFRDRQATGPDTASWLAGFNSRGTAALFSERQWGPLHDLTTYHEYSHLISEEEREDFRSFFYDLSASKNPLIEPYDPLSASPYGNTLVRDMAATFLINSTFGLDATPDFLMLGFSNKPWFRENGGFLPVEKEDMLIRFDRELGELFGFLDERYGRANYLVVLGAGSAPSFLSHRTGSQYRQTGSLFEPRKAASLLNLYLMALYGQGKWVLGMSAGNLYLNHSLIEEQELDLLKVQSQSAEFLMQVSGVELAVRGIDLALLSGPGTVHQLMWDNYFPGRSGDVIFTLRPGWSFFNEYTQKPQNGVSGRSTLPLMVSGWKIKPGEQYNATTYAALVPFLLQAFGLDVPAYAKVE